MRRVVVIAGIVLAIALVFGGAVSLVGTPATETVAPEEAAEPEVFQLEGDESGVWPYLSPSPEPVERSPINVIVRADTETVVTAMQAQAEHDWEEMEDVDGHAEPGAFVPEDVDVAATEIEWGETTGTTRYAYVHDGTDGAWVRETAELHHGTYYGYRTHIRLYESPAAEEPWVAMQVHTEHFDWFTLRHAVDGVEEGQRQVEADFMDQPFVDRVSREFLDNEGPADHDGWTTIVEFAMVLFVLSAVPGAQVARRYLTAVDRQRLRAARDRIEAKQFLMAGAVGGILLAVRGLGILLELHVPALSMHAIAALLYPFIAIGIPVTAYAIGVRFERRVDAAVSATLGLGIAILVDYAWMGVDVLPIEIVLHRIGILLAIGLIAGGAARRATRETRLNELVVFGTVVWVGLLLVMLFELV